MLSSERKSKQRKITEQQTKPSHHQASSFIQQQSNHQSFSQSNCSIESFNHHTNEKDDSEIRFDNGWIYSGQHYCQRFHGWGKLIDSQSNQVYKGNFSNGYFDGYGKMIHNSMFDYIIDLIALQSWIKTVSYKIFVRQQNKNSLKQIQVSSQLNNKKIDNNQIFTFQKYPSYQEEDESLRSSIIQSDHYNSVNNLQWINYKGEFNQGNITGFGTLKIKMFPSPNNHNSRSSQTESQYSQTLYIMGKFVQGRIVAGIIKKR